MTEPTLSCILCFREIFLIQSGFAIYFDESFSYITFDLVSVTPWDDLFFFASHFIFRTFNDKVIDKNNNKSNDFTFQLS